MGLNWCVNTRQKGARRQPGVNREKEKADQGGRVKGYIHRGVLKEDGLVDPSQTITDISELMVLPSDDRLHLTKSGNWSF